MLTKFGFIVTGDHFKQHQGTSDFQMIVVGVKHPSEGVEVAKKMIQEDGVQLIELCGGFGPIWAGEIIKAIDSQVPVGFVGYGPESINGMYKLFEQ
jgi:ketopantoate hydroxymethyltransferase